MVNMCNFLLLFSIFFSCAVIALGHQDYRDSLNETDNLEINRFRILRNSITVEDFTPYESSEAHRRLADEYWKSIKKEVTSSKLQAIIRQTSGYKDAKPFPHMSIMDVFPESVVNAVHLEIADNPRPAEKKGCVLGSKCYNSKLEKSKNAFHDEKLFGPATQAVFAFMQTTRFIKFLEKLTGIDGIMADATYRGAGIHQTLSGGYLNIHADFNLDRKNSYHRRVNVFLYINPNWTDAYGGHLELWSRDLKHCDVRITPDLGKLVVFSTTDFSYHGHQSPLTTPLDRSRRSLAMYYYTKSRPAYECVENNCFGYHTTLFQTTHCPACHDAKCYLTDK